MCKGEGLVSVCYYLCGYFLCCPAPGGARLCGTVTHYALPDVQCVRDYLEIWQDPAISDIILLQTALIYVGMTTT